MHSLNGVIVGQTTSLNCLCVAAETHSSMHVSIPLGNLFDGSESTAMDDVHNIDVIGSRPNTVAPDVRDVTLETENDANGTAGPEVSQCKLCECSSTSTKEV